MSKDQYIWIYIAFANVVVAALSISNNNYGWAALNVGGSVIALVATLADGKAKP